MFLFEDPFKLIPVLRVPYQEISVQGAIDLKRLIVILVGRCSPTYRFHIGVVQYLFLLFKEPVNIRRIIFVWSSLDLISFGMIIYTARLHIFSIHI